MKFFLIYILSTLSIVSATSLFDRCGVCHGAKGQKQSLNLTTAIAGMNKNDVVDILKEYKAGSRDKYGFGKMMKGQASKLSIDDMKELGRYIESFPPVKIVKKTKVNKEISVEKLFKKCSICHGKKGEKKSLGVSKIIAAMPANIIIEELEEYKLGKKNLYGYGNMMRGQTSRLSHKDIKRIAKYIESLPAVKSKEVKREPNREITQEEKDYNTFMDIYFRDSKNPNETFEAAKKSYQKHKNK